MKKQIVIIFFTLLSFLSCEIAVPDLTAGNGGLISITDIGTDTVTLNWTLATGSTTSDDTLEYLAFYSTEQVDETVSAFISDATAFSNYSAGTTSIKITGLTHNTLYYFNVIVKDGVSGKALYKTVSETTAFDPDGIVLEPYYSTVEGLTGDDLKGELNSIIKGHTVFSYDRVWDALIDTDEDPDNPDNFILIYTGRSLPKTAEYPLWNREHVWAKSHGDFGTSSGPGTDFHHLRPSDVSVNGDRGHLDFDNGGNEHSEAIGNYSDSDSWEPRDEVKGDVARMIFYMAVRYEGDDGYVDLEVEEGVNTYPNPLHGNLSVLKQWNIDDPVTDFERNRNNVIYNDWQGNRNPFIDHPEGVNQIW